MYLATAYSSQFIPGATDAKNLDMANKAIARFEEVVGKSADSNKPNINAMLSLASLYSQMKQFDKAKEWCNRILKFYPDNAEAYYRIAVMDYDYASEKAGVDGKNITSLKPEDRAKALADIEDGLTVLGKALEIQPDYSNALEYQNHLWREKAMFEKDPQAQAKLYQQADQAYLKARDLKKKADEAKKSNALGALGGK
jgi:tetratricopeptide (TPR) repeat protein